MRFFGLLNVVIKSALVLSTAFAFTQTYAQGVAAGQDGTQTDKHTGKVKVSPEARAALARLQKRLNEAHSIQFESTISEDIGSGLQRYDITASIRKPSDISVTYTLNGGPRLHAVCGPTGIRFDDGVQKLYGSDKPEHSAETAVHSLWAICNGLQTYGFPAALDDTVDFLHGTEYDLSDYETSYDEVVATEQKTMVNGKTSSEIIIKLFRGKYIFDNRTVPDKSTIYQIILNPVTGLPFRVSQLEGDRGNEMPEQIETFKSFVALSSKLPDSSFRIDPPPSDFVKVILPKSYRRGPNLAALKVGSVCPDFTVERDDGTKIKLSDYAGKVVVIEFWATWAIDSRWGLIDIDGMMANYKEKGVVFVPICTWDRKDRLTKWLKKGEVGNLPICFDPNGEANSIAANLFHVDRVPALYIVGSDGKIAFSYLGFDGGDMAAKIKSQIDKALVGTASQKSP